eukprot:jgi/Botrbrau1/17957/Bobra.50_1s0049.1
MLHGDGFPPGGPPRDTTLPAAPRRGRAGARAAPSPSELSGLGPRETSIEAVGAVSRGSVGAGPSTPRAAPARETEDAEESAVSHKKPAAGFALWSQLPTDVQRRILLSQGLSLRDLARVAPVSKLFSEALPLRFEEEDQWLSGVAPYVFGQHVVDFFLDWLPRTGRYKGIIDSSTPVVDLTKGDALPTGDALLGLKSLVLKLPARGLSSGVHETVLTCHMFISSPQSSIFFRRIDTGRPLLELKVSDILAPVASVFPQNNAEMVACLGLVHQTYKGVRKRKVAEARLTSAHTPGAFFSLNIGTCHTIQGNWARAACAFGPPDEAMEAGRRALSALHIWSCRFPEISPRLYILINGSRIQGN